MTGTIVQLYPYNCTRHAPGRMDGAMHTRMRDLPKYPVPWANRSTTGASVGRFVPGLVRRTPLTTFF